ncbi:uncharacterized protein [Triticum aestivum]|uniref:uncharacterized protein n=1 Tax=Triticum aestivum TaxID=4565 RepID=UPI001D01DE14|nr:uncharacterized protein LOC123067635 [Triticum aestivum]
MQPIGRRDSDRASPTERTLRSPDRGERRIDPELECGGRFHPSKTAGCVRPPQEFRNGIESIRSIPATGGAGTSPSARSHRPSAPSQRPAEQDPVRADPIQRVAERERHLLYWYYIMPPSLALYAHLTPAATSSSATCSVDLGRFCSFLLSIFVLSHSSSQMAFGQLPTAWPARLPSRPGRHWVVRAKDKRCTAADDVAQAPGQHISRMGLKVVPMIAPFSNLCAVNISGNFMGKHCRCRSVRSTEHCQLLLHQTIVLSVSLDGFSKQGGV